MQCPVLPQIIPMLQLSLLMMMPAEIPTARPALATVPLAGEMDGSTGGVEEPACATDFRKLTIAQLQRVDSLLL